MGRLILSVLLLVLPLCPVDGNIYSLDVSHDTRRVMDLGVFGFNERGRISLKVSGLFLDDKDAEKTRKNIGFTLDRVSTALMARKGKNRGKGVAAKKGICFIHDETVMSVEHARSTRWRQRFPLEVPLMQGSPLSLDFPVLSVTEPGLYALFFYNCKKYINETGGDGTKLGPTPPNVPVSFHVDVTQYNLNEKGEVSHVSYGKRFLTEMYMGFTALFLVLLGLWGRELVVQKGRTHSIHHLMTVLLVFKILSLFCETGKEYMHRETGRPSPWSYFYYVFLTLRGIMLFTIIMLIGTGWSFVRPYLNERDKKLVAFVLPLQILIHCVIFYIEGSSEGDAGYATMRNVLLFLDIVCCLVVVLPTIWNIKQITETKGSDKDTLNLTRLKQFRAFYLIVCAYIYFTRLIVPVIETLLLYDKTWIAPFLGEFASFSFYWLSGQKFKPSQESPAEVHQGNNSDEELETQPMRREGTAVV